MAFAACSAAAFRIDFGPSPIKATGRLAIGSMLLLGSWLSPGSAAAECMGNCVQCYHDEFVPICGGAPGAGHCYCSINYIYDTCQGRLFCRANLCEPGQWPPCENARCEPLPAARTAEAAASQADASSSRRVFRPYFRTVSSVRATLTHPSVPRS